MQNKITAFSCDILVDCMMLQPPLLTCTQTERLGSISRKCATVHYKYYIPMGIILDSSGIENKERWSLENGKK